MDPQDGLGFSFVAVPKARRKPKEQQRAPQTVFDTDEYREQRKRWRRERREALGMVGAQKPVSEEVESES